jgi:hypothetical protein
MPTHYTLLLSMTLADSIDRVMSRDSGPNALFGEKGAVWTREEIFAGHMRTQRVGTRCLTT